MKQQPPYITYIINPTYLFMHEIQFVRISHLFIGIINNPTYNFIVGERVIFTFLLG